MESKNSKRSQDVEDLLDLLIAQLIAALKKTPCEHCGQRAVSAMELATVSKFIKDNGFEVKRGDEKDELTKLLESRRRELPDPSETEYLS